MPIYDLVDLIEDLAPVETITSKSSPLDTAAGIIKTPSSSSTIRQLLFLPVLNSFQIFFPSVIFIKFFLSFIIPPIADNLIPLFFTGNIPNESGLAVASQFAFISIILNVIQDGVGNSLFHYVGTNYKLNLPLALVAFKLSLVVLFIGGILLTIMMLSFTSQFVRVIDTPASISEATKLFLHTSAFSLIPTLLKAAFTNYLLISTSTWLVVAQIATVFISFFINFILFGQQSFSLHWGIDKLGIYKVIQSISTMVVTFGFVLVVEKMSPITFIFRIPFFKYLKINFKAFCKVSWGNFGESIVRNFFYFAVTLKFINNLGEDETAAWNLLNGVIWGLILIPGYVVANYVKVRIGHNSSISEIKQVAKESIISLFAWIILMTALTWTFWPILASFFSKSNEKIALLSETMLYNVGWIFIIYACTITIDSFLLATGRTKYIFYQILATNLIVYFVPWILYMIGVLTPTYWWVWGLYIAGVIVYFCLTSLTSYFCFFSRLEIDSD